VLELHLNSEGDENLVRTKIPIFIFGRIDLWYFGMYVARTCSACMIDLLGVVSVLYIMYFKIVLLLMFFDKMELVWVKIPKIFDNIDHIKKTSGSFKNWHLGS
jgi:hypothetical protein